MQRVAVGPGEKQKLAGGVRGLVLRHEDERVALGQGGDVLGLDVGLEAREGQGGHCTASGLAPYGRGRGAFGALADRTASERDGGPRSELEPHQRARPLGDGEGRVGARCRPARQAVGRRPLERHGRDFDRAAGRGQQQRKAGDEHGRHVATIPLRAAARTPPDVAAAGV